MQPVTEIASRKEKRRGFLLCIFWFVPSPGTCQVQTYWSGVSVPAQLVTAEVPVTRTTAS
jgi:hypothetical protein